MLLLLRFINYNVLYSLLIQRQNLVKTLLRKNYVFVNTKYVNIKLKINTPKRSIEFADFEKPLFKI